MKEDVQLRVLFFAAYFAVAAFIVPIPYHQLTYHQEALLAANARLAETMRHAAQERTAYADYVRKYKGVKRGMQAFQAASVDAQRDEIMQAEKHVLDLQKENTLAILLDPTD